MVDNRDINDTKCSEQNQDCQTFLHYFWQAFGLVDEGYSLSWPLFIKPDYSSLQKNTWPSHCRKFISSLF